MKKFSYKSKEGKEVNLGKNELTNLISCAVCGGIGFWGFENGTKEPNAWEKAKEELEGEQENPSIYYEDIFYKVLENGNTIIIEDCEEDEYEDNPEQWYLNWENLQKGCSLYEEETDDSIADLMEDERFDAEDAQLIFQFALFGEIVYG